MTPERDTVDSIVSRALTEDRAFDDITTRLLVPPEIKGTARIVARQSGVISGQDYCEGSFRRLDPEVEYSASVPDGGTVEKGGQAALIHGRLASILSAERTALNFLGHLSGVATRTSLFVGKVSSAGIRILDTRKTLPGLRELEKRAVVDGGGVNHRSDLASYVLVKENHIAAAGGIDSLAQLIGDRLKESEIEVTSLKELEALRSAPPGRVMLDNFSPDMVVEALRVIGGWDGAKPEIEVSGGIDLDNIDQYALPGVDFISVGSLTASAGSMDLSLLVEDGA